MTNPTPIGYGIDMQSGINTEELLTVKNTENFKLYFQHYGRIGGSKKSVKKALASRENGKLGGRPRKQSQ